MTEVEFQQSKLGKKYGHDIENFTKHVPLQI